MNKWRHIFMRWLLVVGAVSGLGLLAGCAPVGGAAEAAPPLALILTHPFTGAAEQLDPLTLAGAGDAAAVEVWSGDGRMGITLVAEAGRANLDPDKTWIVVHALPGGAERARFHPPVSGLAVALSSDGARLLWQPFPLPVGAYPPPVDWYVLDTADGTVMGHVKDVDNACFRQSVLFAPDGERLYCLADPALHDISGPQPIRIAMYRVDQDGDSTASESEPSAEAVLEARIGQRPNVTGTGWELLEPALALSPDGATLALVHADADQLTLIDAATLSISRSLNLRRPSGLLDIFGLSVAPAHAKGETSGTLRHAVFSGDGRRLYVFSQVLAAPDEAPPATRGLWVVDLARGRVTAEALAEYQIQWVVPAPDGTVYAYGTADDTFFAHEIRQTTPSVLWRLDGGTLEVLAERVFVGYRGGGIALGG